MGPAPTSVGRHIYYVSFIDDYSKFTWIYLLKKRSDVFQVFQHYQALVERKFDSKIITVQSDWGGEYEKLNSFFQTLGISQHVSCPHAHQQNGSAECKHRHIVEVGLALLAAASMPLKFWDEAFLTAVYLINILPSRVIKHETPTERLFHTKPDYTPLRVFGCACWPNLRPYNNRKLMFRSKQCVFLGYSVQHKGVKCLDVSTGRVYISRDVVFDEIQFPFEKLHPNAGALLLKEILLLPHTFLASIMGKKIIVLITICLILLILCLSILSQRSTEKKMVHLMVKIRRKMVLQGVISCARKMVVYLPRDHCSSLQRNRRRDPAN